MPDFLLFPLKSEELAQTTLQMLLRSVCRQKFDQQEGPALSEYAQIEIGLYQEYSQNHISIPAVLFRTFREILPIQRKNVLLVWIKRDPPVPTDSPDRWQPPSIFVFPKIFTTQKSQRMPNHTNF